VSRSAALEEVTWRTDELEVTALPGLGCRLHRVRAFGVDLLRTPDTPQRHAEEPFFWGAYVMAPWTNRADPGPMTIAGRRVDLVPNFPDGTAIHGLVSERAWERTGEASFRVEPAPDGWPWAHEVTATVDLASSRLRLTYRLTNRADAPMPGGLGLHPWFRRPVEIALSAGSVQPDNAAPQSEPVPPSGRFALRGGPLPDGLDATWLDVEPPDVGLRWPELGIGARMTLDAGGTPVHVAVASPADVQAVAIEPVTHRPWALRRLADGEPAGMRLLAPGQAQELVITLEFARNDPARTHLAAEERVWLDR
jgi:aldose 1-epimerase